MDYFKRNDVSFLTRDVDLVVNRFDRDGDGRVCYSEFSDDVYPRSREYFI